MHFYQELVVGEYTPKPNQATITQISVNTELSGFSVPFIQSRCSLDSSLSGYLPCLSSPTTDTCIMMSFTASPQYIVSVASNQFTALQILAQVGGNASLLFTAIVIVITVLRCPTTARAAKHKSVENGHAQVQLTSQGGKANEVEA